MLFLASWVSGLFTSRVRCVIQDRDLRQASSNNSCYWKYGQMIYHISMMLKEESFGYLKSLIKKLDLQDNLLKKNVPKWICKRGN